MKIKALFLTLFVAGVVASMAIAKPPPGKGHGKSGDAAAAASPALPTSGKVTLCHKTGKASHWVRIRVAAQAARKRIAKGDVWLQDPAGTCAGAAAKQQDGDDEKDDTTTTSTTTTATTTTATTTTP